MPATHEELRQLQESVLKSAILGENLPGGTVKVSLPDLSFVMAGGVVHLLDENLYGPLSIGPSAMQLRIIGRQALQGQPAAEPAGYLRFGPCENLLDKVKITLETRLPPGPSGAELGLSSAQIEFRKTAAGWIAQAPAYSAN